MDGDSAEWQRGFTALCQYVARRGTTAVPTRAMAAGMAVGAWVNARRQDYWAGRLHPSCVEALESFSGWSWAGRSERRWAARYAALAAYLTEHSGAMTCNPRIGEWATEQRRAHAAGNLPKPLAEQLDTLPGWQWSEDCWQQGLEAPRSHRRRRLLLTASRSVPGSTDVDATTSRAP